MLNINNRFRERIVNFCMEQSCLNETILGLIVFSFLLCAGAGCLLECERLIMGHISTFRYCISSTLFILPKSLGGGGEALQQIARRAPGKRSSFAELGKGGGEYLAYLVLLIVHVFILWQGYSMQFYGSLCGLCALTPFNDHIRMCGFLLGLELL